MKPGGLRIAFIGGRGVISKYSGIEAYYEEVGSRLAARGHDVTVYCRTYFTPDTREHHQMRVLRLPTWRSKHLETLIHTALSTAHALTQHYDVIHYHALGPVLFSFVPRLLRVKTAVTVQGLDGRRKKWGKLAATVLGLAERLAVRYPNSTMVVSHTLRDYYRQRYGAEVLYVANGADLRERVATNKLSEWGLTPGGYVLFLGRFSPEKNCLLLIRAFEAADLPAQLVLAGGFRYADAYAHDLLSHASEKIRFLDYVSGPDLDELLTNAMLFVLPSDMEGLSLALLDAMGAGLCVLASDIPENRELVEGVSYTFRSGDVEDLAGMLRALIASPSVRAESARKARQRVLASYDWDKITDQIEGEYLRISGKPAPGTNVPKPVAGATRPTVHRRVA
jgi:glycosyltransferase involved in cell wall biosynthesis